MPQPLALVSSLLWYVMAFGKCRVYISFSNQQDVDISPNSCHKRIKLISYRAKIYLLQNKFMHFLFLKNFKTFSKLHLKLIFLFFKIFSRNAFLKVLETLQIVFSLVLTSFSSFYIIC